MTARPQWVRDLQMFLSDEMMDEKHGYPEDGTDDWLSDLIEDAVNAILCQAYGHEIIDDMCMIPEHRYCVHCRKRVGQLV